MAPQRPIRTERRSSFSSPTGWRHTSNQIQKRSRSGTTTSTGNIATLSRRRGTRHWRKGRESQSWCGPTRNPATRAISTPPAPPSLTFQRPIAEGGVAFTDESGDLWFEEYIVSPPTHILNGFIWALWGVYDYALATKEAAAQELFARGVRTLLHNLDRYDLGFWSLYEQSGTRLPMVASAFYHRLHIVQLRVMHRLTGEELFARVADRWESYARSRVNRARALGYKSAFKLCYY